MAKGVGSGRARKTSAAQIEREQRVARILGWRLAGVTLAEIAAEEKISTARVGQIIEAELAGRKAAAVDELRRLEADRLDALQAAVWKAASAGNVFAIDRCLAMIARRSRLLGLDAPARLEVKDATGENQAARETLKEKLLALKPPPEARPGDDAKLIEGTVVLEPSPYTVGKEPEPVAVRQLESLPEPDPFSDVLTDDVYGEQALFGP